jgi:PBP1b-binding outer membrane lipoprotein LpoB
MKTVLSLCLIALLFVSCSKKDADETPITDKKVKVEIDLTGDYQDYQLLYSVTTLTTSKGDFVIPEITTPKNMAWTQVIAQANAYNLIIEPSSSKLIVESKSNAGHFAYTLSATQVHNTSAVAQVPITAVVKVYADDKLIETSTYTAKSNGQITEPLSKTIKIN